ncbi:MAG: SEC-C metal-binding domain-containing protein [Egibacteraceae bacterium]
MAAPAVGWFPAEEFDAALAAWPDLRESWEAGTHGEYCRMLEGHLKNFVNVGIHPRLAALRVPVLRDYAAEHELDAGSSDARNGLAIDLLRRGEVFDWPPGRNDPCWCDSDRKYKKCCGPVPPSIIEAPAGN